METLAAFDADVAKLPQWVQIWINIIGVVSVAGVVVMLFNKVTWQDALISFVLISLGVFTLMLLYAQMGMVRLLGVGHIVFWTPLLAYLARRVSSGRVPHFQKWAMIVLCAVISIALVFDVWDVVRWVAGERAQIV